MSGIRGTPVFQSAPLNPGQTYEFKFTIPGVYDYYCGVHGPAMSGRVTVQPGGSAFENVNATPANTFSNTNVVDRAERHREVDEHESRHHAQRDRGGWCQPSARSASTAARSSATRRRWSPTRARRSAGTSSTWISAWRGTTSMRTRSGGCSPTRRSTSAASAPRSPSWSRRRRRRCSCCRSTSSTRSTRSIATSRPRSTSCGATSSCTATWRRT